jgi:hypothetical protein
VLAATRGDRMSRGTFWHGVFICAAASGSLRCSTSHGTADSSLGTVGEAVTAIASTLTLSAPNPLSPIGPVLESSNAIGLGPFVQVESGSCVALGSAGLVAAAGDTLQDVWSAGPVSLSATRVQGTLYAASLVVNVGSTIHAENSSPPISPPSTLSWTVTYSHRSARTATA